MNNNTAQIILLHALCWSKKDSKSGEISEGTRVVYMFKDSSNEQNVVGHLIITEYYNDPTILNKIRNFIDKPVLATFTFRPQYNQSNKFQRVLTKINDIVLVQDKH